MAVRRLDAVPFDGRSVEDRVRDGDLLRASLPEHYGERVEPVVIVEHDIRLDRFELLMEDEQRDAGAVAGDILDPGIGHEDVDRSIPDEVADDVVADLVLRGGRNAQPAR